MEFTIRKVELTKVDIDFDVLYDAIKEDFGDSPDEYDSISEYNEEIAEFFATNESVFLQEVFGLNFNYDGDGSYYDIEANNGVLEEICNAFDDYVRTNKNIQ